MQPFSLDGKVAIVTGASRGIGEAIAHMFAQAGAKVVLASRKAEPLAQVAGQIRAAGGEATPVATHMGDAAAIAALVQRSGEIYGGVDIVVNNAATNPHFGPLLTSEESMWDKTLDVNLRGYYRLISAAVPAMAARGGGKVVNLASIAGLVPSPGMGLYGITKAAVIMLTKTLAVELAPQNIQVNAIAPGFVKTHFSQAIWENKALNDLVISHTPARRMGTVEEIAAMALYLASPASDFTTGQTLVVDGGQTLAVGGSVPGGEGGAS
jgi:NAD(P)-dependent dehydrogenase (short-subunit alcohol dehydrogenase family)